MSEPNVSPALQDVLSTKPTRKEIEARRAKSNQYKQFLGTKVHTEEKLPTISKIHDVYLLDFLPKHFEGTCQNKTIILSPILRSDYVSDSRIALDTKDNMQALIFKVVAFSQKAKDKMPDLEKGKIAIIQNLVGDALTHRVKFVAIKPKYVLCLMTEESLSDD